MLLSPRKKPLSPVSPILLCTSVDPLARLPAPPFDSLLLAPHQEMKAAFLLFTDLASVFSEMHAASAVRLLRLRVRDPFAGLVGERVGASLGRFSHGSLCCGWAQAGFSHAALTRLGFIPPVCCCRHEQ